MPRGTSVAIPETLGERMRARMETLDLKNADVAKAAGVHVKTVSQWLGDHWVPEPDKIERIAKALRVSVGWLLNGDVLSRAVRELSPAHYLVMSRQDATRQVRALASRLEGDLHEAGAEEEDFRAMRTALATDETVRLFADVYEEGQIGRKFAFYKVFVAALGDTLTDRIRHRSLPVGAKFELDHTSIAERPSTRQKPEQEGSE